MSRLLAGLMVGLWSMSLAWAESCMECHRQTTPSIVTDWLASKHSGVGVDCVTCHGGEHTSKDDVAEARRPLPETCGTCHSNQYRQFRNGKHSLAWAAVKIMPPTHQLPMSLVWGTKGCAGCHKIGVKTDEDLVKMKEHGPGFGVASCDGCHTRHLFSSVEARQPQACQTCHMGFDHPQWEMFSTSKHGVRALLKQNGKLPEMVAAPTCQDCHMQEGNHEVRTAWGYLAVRLPLSGDVEDTDWKKDQITILKALGVMDPDGNFTDRLDIIRAADVMRLTKEDWQRERDKMIRTCNQCHSNAFTMAQMKQGDEMVRQTDSLLAEAIRVIAGLYQDGIIQKPQGQAFPFPELLTVHDVPKAPIEQRLFIMFLKHRTSAIHGTFHGNPDYALWNGWAEMVQDLTAIQEMASALRKQQPKTATPG